MPINNMFLRRHVFLFVHLFCRKHLRHLRMLVLQLPVVQGFVYMVLLVMWAEEEVITQYLNFIPVLNINTMHDNVIC